MKVQGPTSAGAGQPAEPVGPTEAGRTEGVVQANTPERTGGAKEARATATPARANFRALVADIGHELAAGKLGPQAALDRVVERVLDRQLGPGAPAAVREQVGAALRDALAEDPSLAEKVRRLTGA